MAPEVHCPQVVFVVINRAGGPLNSGVFASETVNQSTMFWSGRKDHFGYFKWKCYCTDINLVQFLYQQNKNLDIVPFGTQGQIWHELEIQKQKQGGLSMRRLDDDI